MVWGIKILRTTIHVATRLLVIREVLEIHVFNQLSLVDLKKEMEKKKAWQSQYSIIINLQRRSMLGYQMTPFGNWLLQGYTIDPTSRWTTGCTAVVCYSRKC